MPKSTLSARSATRLDLLLAERLKLKRTELGLSQQALAALVGVTFQQVQKYEKGTNRISASRLYAIAQALNVPVTYFFEPLQTASPATAKKAKAPAKKSKKGPSKLRVTRPVQRA